MRRFMRTVAGSASGLRVVVAGFSFSLHPPPMRPGCSVLGPAMSSIFVSYRRSDAPAHAGRIYDRLVDRFGKDNVYMDLDSTPPGADFAEVIKGTIRGCDGLLAVVGRDWLSASRGVRRGRQL